MAIENELDMVLPRIPGGTTVPAGVYFNERAMCTFLATAGQALPPMDWWRLVGTTSAITTTLASAAAAINTALNGPASGLTPVSGSSAYTGYFTANNLSAYTSSSAYLPQSRGQGSQES